MWIVLAIVSALCLGVYDVFKKLSLNANNVLIVLFLNTLFSSLLMAPIIVSGLVDGDIGLGGNITGHLYIVVKAFIVLTSWLWPGGPLLIFGERLNLLQWIGIALGFWSLYFISRIGSKEGFSLKHSRWLWMSLGATFMGAVSALYDKYLLKHYEPLEVQAWYSFYQFIIMGITIAIMLRTTKNHTKFQWRWTIPCISLFLTIADIAYFYSLSIDGSMISVISMIRRGSVIVSFLYGVMALHEKNVKMNLIDLSVLLVGLVCLVLGSR